MKLSMPVIRTGLLNIPSETARRDILVSYGKHHPGLLTAGAFAASLAAKKKPGFDKPIGVQLHLKDKEFGTPVHYGQDVPANTFKEVGAGVVDFPPTSAGGRAGRREALLRRAGPNAWRPGREPADQL